MVASYLFQGRLHSDRMCLEIIIIALSIAPMKITLVNEMCARIGECVVIIESVRRAKYRAAICDRVLRELLAAARRRAKRRGGPK
jgi:hypothetical protein